jgi:hypothetical protein
MADGSIPAGNPGAEPTPNEAELRATTVPAYSMSLSGWDEETCRKVGDILSSIVRALSRYIDMERLAGITVAADYPAALAGLDRGYETSHVLTPTTELGIGIAMTPAVVRDGVIKSHIVFNAALLWPLLEGQEHELWPQTFYTISHECAHVEVTKVFDEAFPGVLLQHRFGDIDESFRWQVIKACWDEYAACRISAPFEAPDTLAGLEETFVLALNTTRLSANAHIRDYRLHGDIDRVWAEVAGRYGDIMKFASYLLGHVHGRAEDKNLPSRSQEQLKDHWFAPYFARLETALEAIWTDYGQWTDQGAFQRIGDILHDVVREGGLIVDRVPEGGYYVDIPFTPETMPAAE